MHISFIIIIIIIIIIIATIIIIIIARHQLDLDRPVSASSKVFPAAFHHLLHNSALFLPSCSCSFLLHVVANLFCIFLVSGQLVLLSTPPKFIHSSCGQKWCTGCSSGKNFISVGVKCFLSFFLGVQIPLPIKRMWRASS
jgi:hypothetical protein